MELYVAYAVGGLILIVTAIVSYSLGKVYERSKFKELELELRETGRCPLCGHDRYIH
jgi:hypothetical protein